MNTRPHLEPFTSLIVHTIGMVAVFLPTFLFLTRYWSWLASMMCSLALFMAASQCASALIRRSIERVGTRATKTIDHTRR